MQMPSLVSRLLRQLVEDRKTRFAGIPFLVVLRVEGASLDELKVVAEARMSQMPTGPDGPNVMTDQNVPTEHEWIRDGLLFDEIEVVEAKIMLRAGNEDLHVEMTLQADEELVTTTSFALVYVLALLSFADARPRGISGQATTTTTNSLRPTCSAT
jgi:hypothetical protein